MTLTTISVYGTGILSKTNNVNEGHFVLKECSLFVYDVQCFLLNTRDSKNIRKPIREIGLNANRRRLHLNNTLQQDRNLLWRREGSNYILNTFTGMEKI